VAPREFPGFVDLQINGYMGTDFSGDDLTEETCAAAFRAIIDSGTTAFLPTVITSSKETYRRNLPTILRAAGRAEFRDHVLGLHLEGPLLSPEPGAIGAHNPALATRADLKVFRELHALCGDELRILTVAADVDGVEEVIAAAVEAGVTVSLGHHLALEDDLDRAVQAGASALTHLGNGLPLTIPRHRNPIFAGLAEDRLTAMIITDGHHIPPSLIKTVLRTKGVERTVVTSDASPLAGLPPGKYRSMGADVILEESGRLYDPAKGNLAGSAYSMTACMNVLAGLDLLSYEELYAVGVTNPLRLVGRAEAADRAGADERTHLRFDGAAFRVERR
jgi:N-acetylglucosamine-6-phosphate deacetylase